MKPILIFFLLVFTTFAQCVSVKDSSWGVTVYGNGVNDDTVALQTIANNSQNKCIAFAPGTYKISSYIRWEKNNVTLQGNGAVFQGVVDSSGNGHDGFRIGRPGGDVPEGGNTAISTFDVSVTGFVFKSTRIGVWVVYCRRVHVQDIRSDGTAVVAIGNDNESGSEYVTVRDIQRTGAVLGNIWYTLGILRSSMIDVSNVTHATSIPVNAIAVGHSKNVTLTNIAIDQINKAGSCVDISDSEKVLLTAFQLTRCNKGVVLYFSAISVTNPTLIRDQENKVSTGIITDSLYGVVLYSSKNVISDVGFKGIGGNENSSAIFWMADGRYNTVIGNTIRDLSNAYCFQQQTPGVFETSTIGAQPPTPPGGVNEYIGSNICVTQVIGLPPRI